MLALLLACSTSPLLTESVDTCPAYSGLGPSGSWRRWEHEDGSWMETLVSARHLSRQGHEDLLVDTVLETDDTRIDLHVVARCDASGMTHMGAEVETTTGEEPVLNSVALGELVLPHGLSVGDELPDGGVVVDTRTQTIRDELVDTLEVRYEVSEEMCGDTTVWLNTDPGLVRSEGDPDCTGDTEVLELVAFGD